MISRTLKSGLQAQILAGTFCLGFLLSLGCAVSNPGPGDRPQLPIGKGDSLGSSDPFAVVDCLLPGQIRQLGSRVTYLTERRPIKTTTEDCVIRGGEYVSADRAEYGTALKIWMDSAQKGDAEAQYYVATLYEKGADGQPNYEQATQWYQKAAEQGFSRAAINLGRLYEQGLGVSRDPGEAFKWYARASGLKETNLAMLTSASTAARIRTLEQTVASKDRAIQDLRQGLADLTEELLQLRQQLQERTVLADQARVRLQQVQEEYNRVQNDLQAARSRAQENARFSRYKDELEGVTIELHERRRALEERDQEITRLRERMSRLQETADRIRNLERTVEQKEQNIDQLHAQLASVNEDFIKVHEQLEEKTNQTREDREELQRLKERNEQVRTELEKARAESTRTASITQYEQELEKLRTELGERQAILKEKEKETTELHEQIAKLESEAQDRAAVLASAPVVDLGLNGPSVEILDPPLVITRDIRVEKRPIPVIIRFAAHPTLTGRVLAPAGLRSLTVNGHPTVVGENGMFMVQLPVLRSGHGDVPVDILAIDIQNKRTVLQLLLQTGSRGVKPHPSLSLDLTAFGKYYALIIGNDRYQQWTPLKNAVSDATAVAEVLQSRYGFQVTLLTNASRRDILKALNDMRKRLTDKDNLLIYYAGHGHLESEIDRGYWIPIEAQVDDNSDWILLPTVTDLLQLMAAKHVFVVADSCFAGKLTRSSLAKLQPDLSEEARLSMLETLAQKRVRTALTSGGVRPVLDSGGGGHSVFARAFLEVLQENSTILEAERLFWAVRARVMRSASQLNAEQIPTYSPIHLAGHESLGDFIFVPQQS